MRVPQELDDAARARVTDALPYIDTSLKMIRQGIPLAAEPDTERLIQRIQRKSGRSRQEAETLTLAVRSLEQMDDKTRTAFTKGAEAIQGTSMDFVGIAFLSRGLCAARSVGRVAFGDRRPQGSGFMVGERLFITNKHVVHNPEFASNLVVEFDYELDDTDKDKEVTRFQVDPSTFYIDSPVTDLDYAIVALGNKIDGPCSLSDFGRCRLSDAADKHALGEVANIVQHPDGRRKEVVLRENRLVARSGDFALHYVADTEPGSSGSPVFNNEWEVIALHHWGTPFRQKKDDAGRLLPLEINEGIRVSAIVAHAQDLAGSLGAEKRQLLESLFSPETVKPGVKRSTDNADRRPFEPKLAPDGTVSWNIPLEISVRIPGLKDASVADAAPAVSVKPAISPDLDGASSEGLKPSTTYSDRRGYKPKFIPGFVVPLPQLSDAQKQIAARNLEADDDDDPFELKYHHFSIVMNKQRRLAFFTACNIDGKRAMHVDRKTGTVKPLTVADVNHESLGSEQAEASETWYDDKRLNPSDFAGKGIYDAQKIAGFPKPQERGRILRMFQRGHLVRRMDPAWGSPNQALLADADTFHWTNCSPQVGFFNMGQAAASTPNSGGGKLWRAMENYVLRNAVVTDSKICSFTGPVFRTNDRKFRGIKVPKRFWKIVVWKEDGKLRSMAMIADQSKVIEVWPEALDAFESFADPDELSKVEDFLSTVAEIEQKTGLDFGSEVRAADIFAGESIRSIVEFPDLSDARRYR